VIQSTTHRKGRRTRKAVIRCGSLKKVSFEVTVKAPSLFMFQQVYYNFFVIYS